MRAHRPRDARHRADWSKPGLISRLGLETDHAIGLELGVSRERVRQVRKQLGIGSNRDRDRLPPALRERLGSAKDSVLAAEYGVSSHTVSNERKKAGIASYRRPCGTITKYNTGCRCVLCRQANADRMADYFKRNPDASERGKKQQRKKIRDSAPHAVGKIGWYTLGCRCDGCREAAKNHVSQPRKPRPVEMPVSAYAASPWVEKDE